ncbi:MAG: GTPase [Candidatus Hodarchaeales archaeon]|jgi:small GTP-binding protein
MSTQRKFKWYRFNVIRRIRILEGEELISELEDIIADIKKKRLDKAGIFRLLIQQLEGLIIETRFKPKQKGRQYDPFHIPRSGDGRIVLFGLSNVGKSTLMNAITNTEVETSNFLHTTKTALAGTCEFKDVKIQIIDVPGFLDFKEDWAISKQIVRVARTCDAILLVIDLSLDIKRQFSFLMDQLENANLKDSQDSLFKLGVIATKGDLPGSKKNFQLLKSVTSLPIHPITIKNGESLENLKEFLFEILEVMKIYTKPPRSEADYKHPFICPVGTTIGELAEKIHRDFIKLFRYAKVWGPSVDFPGQQIGLEHILMDTDIVEITIRRT